MHVYKIPHSSLHFIFELIIKPLEVASLALTTVKAHDYFIMRKKQPKNSLNFLTFLAILSASKVYASILGKNALIQQIIILTHLKANNIFHYFFY